MLVTTAEEDRLRRASSLISDMQEQGLSLSAIIINRFLDEETWKELGLHTSKEPAMIESIRRLRSSLHKEIEHARGVGAVVDFLEEYRERTLSDIARVEKFARELPSAIKLAIAPEIEVGVRDLAALARVADFLTMPHPLGRLAAHDKAKHPAKDGKPSSTRHRGH